MTLYDGIYGLVLGGPDPDLSFEQPFVSSLPAMVKGVRNVAHSLTLRAVVKSATLKGSSKLDKEILDLLLEGKIGVDCNLKCNGCQCGQCPVGNKSMSLHDEREYYKFRSNLIYDETGTDTDPGPYWRTRLPWNIDRNELVDNKAAVIAVMNSTKRKLKRDTNWEEVYETQLKKLIDKGFAREVSQQELIS